MLTLRTKSTEIMKSVCVKNIKAQKNGIIRTANSNREKNEINDVDMTSSCEITIKFQVVERESKKTEKNTPREQQRKTN